MNVLVANLGSTSFKYRLYRMPAEELLARGGVERVGSADARTYVIDPPAEAVGPVPDHGAALAGCLDQLTAGPNPTLGSVSELHAVGFKAVHGGEVSGARVVDDTVLSAMEGLAAVAPAHNPPYVRAMRKLRERFPNLPLVAAFETDFHQTTPEAYQHYAVPYQWYEKHGVRRYGFHGASHRYIATRVAELTGEKNARIISCHLGGSSSVCAIQGRESRGNTMGMSPQGGIPNNNRVGDFDVFALPYLMERTGKDLQSVLADLSERSGLLGISGISNDLRDIEGAAATGDRRAKLAVDVLVAAVRDAIGSYAVRLGGLDHLVFTGGIGENSASLRAAVCDRMQFLGVELDDVKNQNARGETMVSGGGSRIKVWTLPTNEEIVVARQSVEAVRALNN